MIYLKLVIESLKNNIKENLEYRGNAISWFIADIVLYSTLIMSYRMLFYRTSSIGGYGKNEMLLLISTFFLCNNIFSLFFSDGISKMSKMIRYGGLDFHIIKPINTIFSIINSGINCPAGVITPFLLVLNFSLLPSGVNLLTIIYYYFSVIIGAYCLAIIMLIVSCLNFYVTKADSISSILTSLLVFGERPDTIFPKYIRGFLTFCIPIYLMSTLPTKFILGRIENYEAIWIIFAPILLTCIFKLSWTHSVKRYKSSNMG